MLERKLTCWVKCSRHNYCNISHPGSLPKHFKHRMGNNEHLLLQCSKTTLCAPIYLFPLTQRQPLQFCPNATLSCHSGIKQQLLLPPPFSFMQLCCVTIILICDISIGNVTVQGLIQVTTKQANINNTRYPFQKKPCG